jgi:hypothetical protein
VAVYDLGTQEGGDFWKGKKMQRKAYIEWEIQDERIELERDGKTVNLPRTPRQKYTLSLNEKATLRKHLDSWRGRPFTAEELDGFDILKLIGANCYLNIIHEAAKDNSGKVYANIASITPLMKKDAKLAPESRTVFFSFDDGQLPGEEVPEWIRKIMADSPEYRAIAYPKSAPAGDDDDPFAPPSQERTNFAGGDSTDMDDVPF